MPRRYCTKSIVVDAIQVTNNNLDYVAKVVRGSHYVSNGAPHGYHYRIDEESVTELPKEEHAVILPTEHGLAKVGVGDWIAFDEQGHHYPFTDEAFWVHHEIYQDGDE